MGPFEPSVQHFLELVTLLGQPWGGDDVLGLNVGHLQCSCNVLPVWCSTLYEGIEVIICNNGYDEFIFVPYRNNRSIACGLYAYESPLTWFYRHGT